MRALLILAVLCGTLRAEPKFLGMLSTAKDGTFFAISSSEGRSSSWLTIGDSIDGYLIAGYKAREEQLVLRRGGAELILPLKTSKVRDAAPIDEASIRKLAKEIVARWEGWDPGTIDLIVWYKTDWNVVVTRIVDGKKEIRIISSPDGFLVSAPK